MGKKLFCLQILLLFRWKIFLCRAVLKVQHVMLIKMGEFWCFFYPDFLGGKTTGDVLNKFYCIGMFSGL
jgi:hypothetical protein